MIAEWYLSPAVWSYGIATLAFASFAVQLSLGWRGGRAAFFLLASVILSAFWAAASCAFAVAPSAPMWASAQVFDVLAIGSLLAFLISLFAARRRPLWLILPAAATVSAALFMGAPPPGVPELGRSTHGISFALLLAMAVLGMTLVEVVYRRTSDARRWNVRPLCVGLAGIFLFDLVLYADALLFRVLDEPLWAARGLTHALVIPFLAIAASRNKQWELEVSISRGVLTQSSTLLAVGLYLLGVAGAGYYVRIFGGSWGATLAAVIVFAALLVLAFIAISETFRAKLRVLVAKNFFAYRYDYREEWLSFTRTLSASGGEAGVQSRCISALADLVESTGGSLWLRREGAYAEVERTVGAPVANLEPADSVLTAFLSHSGWVLDVGDVRRDPGKYPANLLPDWIDEVYHAWLVVPLINGEQLIGFVVLARARVEVDPNWEVWDLLKTAGTQAASYLALYQATEALLEARKFDAFNRMSAFVVHDLKNLVAQLSLMLRNAERHAANPDFQRDMLRTVEHVVGRMNHLMLQLRSGESPIDNPRAVDLAALVRNVQSTRVANARAMEVVSAVGVWALGHEDRLERVVAHLVQNGIEAAGERAHVVVRTFRDGDRAVVEIIDNGMGMSQEFIQNQLFKPFASTKDKGMGIGAYESHQYVTSLGGRIGVESTPGQGTTVRVFLPAAPPQGVFRSLEAAA